MACSYTNLNTSIFAEGVYPLPPPIILLVTPPPLGNITEVLELPSSINTPCEPSCKPVILIAFAFADPKVKKAVDPFL